LNESPSNTPSEYVHWQEVKSQIQDNYNSAQLQMIQYYLLDFGQDLSINKVIGDLKAQRPIQYIVGHAYFHKYHFMVNDSTLIPRPETEELCQLILHTCSNRNLKICDLGTGSGCILNTLLSENKSWTGIGVDLDKIALETASQNAIYWDTINRTQWLQMDILGMDKLPPGNILISNPPYIPKTEITQMDKNVVAYEPHLALFVEEDPLIFYKKIYTLFQSDESYTDLFFECHQDYIEDLMLFLLDKKTNAKKIEDLSQNPRFIHVTK